MSMTASGEPGLPITLTAHNMPITDALRQLADASGVEIRCSLPISDAIMVNTAFRNATLERALDKILKGLSYAIVFERDPQGRLLVSVNAANRDVEGAKNIKVLAFVPQNRPALPDELVNKEPVPALLLLNPPPTPEDLQAGLVARDDEYIKDYANNDPPDPVLLVNPLPMPGEMADGKLIEENPYEKVFRNKDPVSGIVVANPAPEPAAVVAAGGFMKGADIAAAADPLPVDPVVAANPMPRPEDMTVAGFKSSKAIMPRNMDPVDKIVLANPMPLPEHMSWSIN